MNDHTLDPGFDFEGFARRLADAIFPEKPSAFARRAGVSSGLISKYLAAGGSTGHRLDIVARIAEAAGVSLDWLVWAKGDGESAGQTIRVPRYDATLAAGAGSWNDGRRRLDDIPFTPAFFQKRLGNRAPGNFSVLEAKGDSMAPAISDGDLLLIDESDTRIIDGVFAFLLDGDARVKRFRRKLDGISIISDNPAYEPEDVPANQLDKISVIGRVRWVGSMVA